MGLANTYNIISGYPGGLPSKEAKVAALKALELDSSLAEAHTALALVKVSYEWAWPGAERKFKRALELKPNYSTLLGMPEAPAGPCPYRALLAGRFSG